MSTYQPPGTRTRADTVTSVGCLAAMLLVVLGLVVGLVMLVRANTPKPEERAQEEVRQKELSALAELLYQAPMCNGLDDTTPCLVDKEPTARGGLVAHMPDGSWMPIGYELHEKIEELSNRIVEQPGEYDPGEPPR